MKLKKLPKKWISVEEKLPKHGINVLVHGKSKYSFGYGMRKYLTTEVINTYDTFEVTHWAYDT